VKEKKSFQGTPLKKKKTYKMTVDYSLISILRSSSKYKPISTLTQSLPIPRNSNFVLHKILKIFSKNTNYHYYYYNYIFFYFISFFIY